MENQIANFNNNSEDVHISIKHLLECNQSACIAECIKPCPKSICSSSTSLEKTLKLAGFSQSIRFLLRNDNSDVFCEFIQKMLNNIKRIAYKNKNALKKVQEELINYLKESIYLSLSLNPNFIYQDKNKNNDYILKQAFKKLIQNEELGDSNS